MAHNRISKLLIIALAATILTGVLPFSNAAAANIPVTANGVTTSASDQPASALPLADFVSAIKDGEQAVRGVYVKDVMALRVIQQPTGQAGFVSAINGIVTQFRLAEQFGNIGLLAHNFASGSLFPKLEKGSVVKVVYGDGSIKDFSITAIRKYQAVSPNSPTSNFIDLETGEKLTAAGLFEREYKGSFHVVLQTCIAFENEASWGRLFITAEPLVSTEREITIEE